MATSTPNYTVDYNDKRFTEVINEKNNTINDLNNTYNNLINESQQNYQNLMDTADKYAQDQSALQQQRADYEKEVIENEKANAQKDFEKQQKASYIDYKQATNQYGANAQATRDLGLQNSGYSETSQVAMFNTYQNRIATAKESFDRAVTDYNLAIKDIQLQNDSKLMEISYNALQSKLELSLKAFAEKNSLLQAQMDRQYQYNVFYDNKYQNVLSQINTENSLAEQVRQYNESMAYKKQKDAEEMAYQKERDRIADEQWQKSYNLQKAKVSSSGSGSGAKVAKEGNVSNVTDTGFEYKGRKIVKDSKGTYYFQNSDGSATEILGGVSLVGNNILTMKETGDTVYKK